MRVYFTIESIRRDDDRDVRPAPAYAMAPDGADLSSRAHAVIHSVARANNLVPLTLLPEASMCLDRAFYTGTIGVRGGSTWTPLLTVRFSLPLT